MKIYLNKSANSIHTDVSTVDNIGGTWTDKPVTANTVLVHTVEPL